MRKSLLLGLSLLSTALVAPAQDATYYFTNFNGDSFTELGFAVEDANNDGKTWVASSNTSRFDNLDGEKTPVAERTYAKISSGTHNDWLISPGITFETGKTYQVTVIMAKFIFASYDSCFEIMLGDEKNSESMTTTLLPTSASNLGEYPGNSLWTKTFTIAVDHTADYYLGIHATGKCGGTLGVAQISIAAGVALSTPMPVSDLTLIPDANGLKKVAVEFITPSKAKDGSDLTELTKVEIRREGQLVHTIDAPAKDSHQSFTDAVATSAIYTYTVTPYNANGPGEPAEAKTFVGVNTPTPAVGVIAVNTGNTSAKITWNAPSLDKDGYPIAASIIKYDVYRAPLYKSSEKEKIATGIKVLEFDDAFTPEDATQQFYSYSVVAKTAEGAAAEAVAAAVPMGEPYAAPFIESFPNGRPTTITTSMPVTDLGNNYWQPWIDFEDISAADGDNGMIFLTGGIGGAAAINFGLVDIADMPAPTINFYTYNIIPADPKDNEVQVTVTATDGTVAEFPAFAPGMGWNKYIFRLDNFKGKTVRATITGFRNNSTELHLDAIAISNIYQYDLRAADIEAPATARTSEPFDVKVTIVNNGSDPIDAYTVELLCNGTKVDSFDGSGLKTGEFKTVAFERTHSVTDPEKVTYSARVTYTADQDASNNEVTAAPTTVRRNAYPTVTDLSGEKNGSTIRLQWGEPDTQKAQPYETLETFEQYQSWANTEVGEWVLVDMDKALIAGFSTGNMPGIPDYSEQSWWVFDNKHDDFNNGTLSTLSGSKFLASMVSGFVSDGIHEPGYAQNDDWAISPELYGGSQTITVNARSYGTDQNLLETFEVLYSTGSVDPADFISVKTIENVPSEFTTYNIDLPDGAKRFAIRNISFGKYLLMVDDITYIPVGDPAAFSINGYNVYRDGVLLNTEPVEENEYEDIDSGDGDHTYHVTVLYSAGESQFSNAYSTNSTGVENISAEDNAPVRYYNLQGMPVASPQAGRAYIRVQGNKVTKTIIK